MVADFLMTLTIPIKVLSDAGVGSWQLRVVYCRYSAVLFYTTMYISIILLGLISLDRYLKIVRPFGKGPLQRVRVAQALSAGVWVVMLALALPNTVLSNRMPLSPGPKFKCTSMKGAAGMSWHEGFTFFCMVRGVRRERGGESRRFALFPEFYVRCLSVFFFMGDIHKHMVALGQAVVSLEPDWT